MPDDTMIPVTLDRIVIRDGTSHQYIYLAEADGERGFPIVIGNYEAIEIRRVVREEESPRPLTHQLAYSAIRALGADLKSVDIVDLRQNTFFAHIVLQNEGDDVVTVVDARPSDAIALALRGRCPIRVAQSVLERAAVDNGQADEDEDE